MNKFCCLSTFKASFLFGFIFLFYYTAIIAGSSIHLFETKTFNDSVRFTFTLFIIGTSSFTIVTVVLMFIGLCTESRRLLLPFIVMLIFGSIIEFCNSLFNYTSIYLFQNLINFCQRNIELLAEIVISLIKCFAILCIYSETKKVKKNSKYRDSNFANAMPGQIRSINKCKQQQQFKKQIILVEDSSF